MRSWLISLLIFFSHSAAFCAELDQGPLNLVILGLGGRAQWLLIECLKLKEDIRVIAVCDDNARECIDDQLARFSTIDDPRLLPLYQAAMADATLYRNTPDELHRLFAEHSDVSTILITSANSDHFTHLSAALEHAQGKKIFMEKPLFKTLDEFNRFEFKKAADDAVTIGLTLRFSSMAQIVAEQLKAHQRDLGPLQSVNVWERLSFQHAFTAFIMGEWRRYISTSGGLMLEKVVHDGDLALFFLMDALKIEPSKMRLSTVAAHQLFTRSRRDELLEYVKENKSLKEKIASKSEWKVKNYIQYQGDGSIDWAASLDRILEEYPENDDFTNSDLIPDTQKLHAKIETISGDSIDFQLEVDMAGFRPATERGQLFTFEKGHVHVDVMGSRMHIHYNDGQDYMYDLKTNGSDHADGDEFIIQTIVGEPLSADHITATLNDPIVRLANLMILISENQAETGIESSIIEDDNGSWVIRDQEPLVSDNNR